MPERVVITGVGAVTPVGLNAPSSIDAVFAGRSGIRALESIDVSDLEVRIGGEVRGFEVTSVLPRSDARRLDPHAHYAIAATLEAIEQASPGGLPATADRTGIWVGTSAGPVSLVQEGARVIDARGPSRVGAGVVVYGGSDSAAAWLSVRLGVLGPTSGIGATCASGAVAIGEALRAIRHGYLDAAIAIGAEHCINRVNLAANANIRALTRDFADAPERASRPFDANRSGFVMSSGAAAVVLESLSNARARGATPLAEVLGYGASSDAHHATAPHPEGRGAVQAMRQTLEDAALSVGDIDHVNAHATSTPQGDEVEAAAIHTLFGPQAPPVTATKSVTGHLLGASGVFEAIVSVAALERQQIAPTLNLDEQAGGSIAHLDIVTGEARPLEMNAVMSNSFGFGGHNASLILGTPPAL